mgnify:CR=1 FL=1
MLLLSHQKKIVLVALSLFFVSLSLVFVMSGESGGSLTNSVLGSFFESHPSAETGGHETDTQETVSALTVSKTGEVISLNPAFVQTFGYGHEDLTSDIYSLFHSDDLSSFIRDFTKFSQEKHPKETVSGPFRFLTKSGDYHLVLLTFLTEKEGIHIGFKDITQSVQDLDKKPSSGSGGGKKIQDLQEKDGARIVVEKMK